MAKRHDKNDSTMDISASQLVPEKRPQPPVVNKNDVSMWIGGVVGADEFAGKKKSASKSRAPVVIGAVALLGALGGGAYYMFGRTSSSPARVAAPAITIDAAPAEPPAPIATMPVDAGAEAAPSDAAVAAPDALVADAVSAADPAPKKKPTTKKKTVKKKPATTKKRR